MRTLRPLSNEHNGQHSLSHGKRCSAWDSFDNYRLKFKMAGQPPQPNQQHTITVEFVDATSDADPTVAVYNHNIMLH